MQSRWENLVDSITVWSPDDVLLSLRDSGRLGEFYPQLDGLVGVEIKYPHHDAFEHTMTVMREAFLINMDLGTIFGALVHDLGKALTDPADYPSHYGHEKNGVKITEEFCDLVGAPHYYREIATVVTRFHTHVHRLDDMRSNTVLRLFETINAFEKPYMIETLANVALADARAVEDFSYINQMKILKLFHAASNVNIEGLYTELKMEPEEREDSLRLARLTAIKEERNAWNF